MGDAQKILMYVKYNKYIMLQLEQRTSLLLEYSPKLITLAPKPDATTRKVELSNRSVGPK